MSRDWLWHFFLMGFEMMRCVIGLLVIWILFLAFEGLLWIYACTQTHSYTCGLSAPSDTMNKSYFIGFSFSEVRDAFLNIKCHCDWTSRYVYFFLSRSNLICYICFISNFVCVSVFYFINFIVSFICIVVVVVLFSLPQLELEIYSLFELEDYDNAETEI